MTVLRHYFIGDNLDDLENFEEELEARGVETAQIHVLSFDDTATESHAHLHDVSSFMKSDVVRSGEMGLAIGIAGALVVLAVAYFSGWTQSVAGWIPFIFSAVVVIGFCTWEGGFLGFQRINTRFKQFEQVLNEGRHVFFVDLMPDQEDLLNNLVKQHPGLEHAGTQRGTPMWLMKSQKHVPHFLRESMP